MDKQAEVYTIDCVGTGMSILAVFVLSPRTRQHVCLQFILLIYLSLSLSLSINGWIDG